MGVANSGIMEAASSVLKQVAEDSADTESDASPVEKLQTLLTKVMNGGDGGLLRETEGVSDCGDIGGAEGLPQKPPGVADLVWQRRRGEGLRRRPRLR